MKRVSTNTTVSNHLQVVLKNARSKDKTTWSELGEIANMSEGEVSDLLQRWGSEK